MNKQDLKVIQDNLKQIINDVKLLKIVARSNTADIAADGITRLAREAHQAAKRLEEEANG